MILIVVIFSLFVIVPPGHVGVLVTLGKVNSTVMTEGINWKVPFMQSVKKMNVRLLKSSETVSASSKDLQSVITKVEIQYSLIGSFAPSTYQNIGLRTDLESKLVDPAIQESVKAITARYTAEQLITKRSEVKININVAINQFIYATLKERNLERILKISNIAITDFNFSDEFNQAIELKVRAEQQALQAKNEKEKRITQAEAAAAEKKLAADAEAYQITAASTARAMAIRREARALKGNPELIKLRATEKWDGVLPRFSGSQVVPFLNLKEEK